MKKAKLIVIGSVFSLYLLILILLLIKPIDSAVFFFIDFFALFGLTSMFIATMIAPFQKELFRIFRKPFIKIHHAFSITGFILIVLHPLTLAIHVNSWEVFLPDFSSWYNFWLLAGRPALILIVIALIASILKKQIGDYWKYIHMLNYVGLIFGVIHGILLASTFSDFSKPLKINELIITILFLTMTVVSVSTFIYKRYLEKLKRDKRKEKMIKDQ